MAATYDNISVYYTVDDDGIHLRAYDGSLEVSLASPTVADVIAAVGREPLDALCDEVVPADAPAAELIAVRRFIDALMKVPSRS